MRRALPSPPENFFLFRERSERGAEARRSEKPKAAKAKNPKPKGTAAAKKIFPQHCAKKLPFFQRVLRS